MKRRDMLSGLAMAGMELEAQEHPSESLYIPKPHLVEDRKLLHDFMDEFPFAKSVICRPALPIRPPVFLDRTSAGSNTATLPARNPQLKRFDSPAMQSIS